MFNYPEDDFDERKVKKAIIIAVLGIGALIFFKKRMRKKKKSLLDWLYLLKEELMDLAD